MANLYSLTPEIGKSTTIPPYFDGLNYPYWKDRMSIYLQSNNIKLWKIIRLGYSPPIYENSDNPILVEELDDTQLEIHSLNAKVMNSIICALSPSEYSKISACKTAKEMWNKLEIMHEGTNQVNECKLQILVHEYELFRMNENETISDMLARFTTITNGLIFLGKCLSCKEMISKVLRSLPKE